MSLTKKLILTAVCVAATMLICKFTIFAAQEGVSAASPTSAATILEGGGEP